MVSNGESVSFYFDLQQLRDAELGFISMLSSNRRQQRRRTIRAYEVTGAVSVTPASTTDEALDWIKFVSSPEPIEKSCQWMIERSLLWIVNALSARSKSALPLITCSPEGSANMTGCVANNTRNEQNTLSSFFIK